jgi:hypothetical protein
VHRKLAKPEKLFNFSHLRFRASGLDFRWGRHQAAERAALGVPAGAK